MGVTAGLPAASLRDRSAGMAAVVGPCTVAAGLAVLAAEPEDLLVAAVPAEASVVVMAAVAAGMVVVEGTAKLVLF